MDTEEEGILPHTVSKCHFISLYKAKHKKYVVKSPFLQLTFTNPSHATFYAAAEGRAACTAYTVQCESRFYPHPFICLCGNNNVFRPAS